MFKKCIFEKNIFNKNSLYNNIFGEKSGSTIETFYLITDTGDRLTTDTGDRLIYQ